MASQSQYVEPLEFVTDSQSGFSHGISQDSHVDLSLDFTATATNDITNTQDTAVTLEEDGDESERDRKRRERRERKDRRRHHEEEHFAEPPHWACAYCGIYERNSVIQCNDCKRWFCNGRGSTSGSHIVHHLVRAHHKSVSMHKESSLGDTAVECYACQGRNLFMLGYVPAKQDAMVILLCRNPCASRAVLKDVEWDANEWTALITDRRIVSWLVKHPTEKEEKRARPVSAPQMVRLEEAWKTNAEATIDDLNQPGFDKDPECIRYFYTDAYEYQQVFGPLIDLQAEYDRRMKEGCAHYGVRVKWEWGLNHKRQAHFCLPKLLDGDVRLTPGDELRLKINKGFDDDWVGEGVVLKVPDGNDENVIIEMKGGIASIPTNLTSGYTCEMVWKSTSFDRMRHAMRSFARDENSMSEYIYEKLLGHRVDDVVFNRPNLPKKLNAPNLPELNASQMQAVKISLTRPLSLIQGPPGTGKTVTSATIVYHLATTALPSDGGKHVGPKVLVCAPTNIAVDALCEKIDKTGVKVVRLLAKSHEQVNSSVSHLSLHNQIKNLPGYEDFAKLETLREEMGELSLEDESRWRSLRNAAERVLLMAADVVCVTCISGGGIRLKGMQFRCVLIDEATQALEPECLVPLVHGTQQLVLVGDHQQLGAVVQCKKADEAGLSQSLFERLIRGAPNIRVVPHMLQVQYRMHPILSEFPSSQFYDGHLQNGVVAADRRLNLKRFPWPNVDKPMFFWHSSGSEEIYTSGTSFINVCEATYIERLATALMKSGVQPEQIGVITPYAGQKHYITHYMATQGTMPSTLYHAIEVASVDAFQGREKDIILMSCVRSNEHQGIGFLNDYRRLNVAITRAKYGLIVVGNFAVLSRYKIWHEYLAHFRNYNLLMEGKLFSLTENKDELSQPRPTEEKFRIRTAETMMNGGTHMPPSMPPMPHMYMPTPMAVPGWQGGGHHRHMAPIHDPQHYMGGGQGQQPMVNPHQSFVNIPMPLALVQPPPMMPPMSGASAKAMHYGPIAPPHRGGPGGQRKPLSMGGASSSISRPSDVINLPKLAGDTSDGASSEMNMHSQDGALMESMASLSTNDHWNDGMSEHSQSAFPQYGNHQPKR